MSDDADLAPPSQDPADLGTLAGVIKHSFRKLMQNTDGMLPVTIIAADAQRNYVSCKPLVQVKATTGKLTSRAALARIPILTMGAGGFVMSFPLKGGDLGWIIAGDRDHSLVLQKNAEAGPNSHRIKSFSDGLFIPDAARRWVLDGEDANNATWQNLDGTVKITIGPNSIKLAHPTKVEVVTPKVTMSGDLEVTGDVRSGPNTISLNTHTHDDVQSGTDTTGPPTT